LLEARGDWDFFSLRFYYFWDSVWDSGVGVGVGGDRSVGGGGDE